MSKKVYVDLSQQDVQDIINAYEKDIEKFNKQKEVLDDIRENLKNTDFEYLKLTNNHCLADYLERLLELLEEIDSETRK